MHIGSFPYFGGRYIFIGRLDMASLKVKLTFIEELLGMSPSSTEIYQRFILSKAHDPELAEEELSSIDSDGASSTDNDGRKRPLTVFPRDVNDTPFIYDYQVKGYFKDACSMLARVKDGEGTKKTPLYESGKLTAYKKIIDGLIFPTPRKILISASGSVGLCERPLRASTPQGERIALASSETCPEGSTIEFTVLCLSDVHIPLIREWLDYGALRGFGQWRNSGKGRFVWEELAA
jgi:hypothetical protein